MLNLKQMSVNMKCFKLKCKKKQKRVKISSPEKKRELTFRTLHIPR